MNVEEFEQVAEESKPAEAPAEVEKKEDPEKPKEAPELAELKRQLKEERKARKQAEEGMRHWYDRASRAGEPEPKKPAEEEDKPLSVDLVEALTSGNRKAIEKGLRELGFARVEEIDRRIASTRAEITQEAQLYGRYPDLQDEESEFYKTTLEIYKDLAKDPVIAKSPGLVAIAAKQAARVLEVDTKKAPAKRRAAEPDEEPDEEEIEDERRSRVMRQAGGGRTAPRQREPEIDPGIERAAKSLVERLRSEGANITVEGLLKRREKGVTLSSGSFYRGRQK